MRIEEMMRKVSLITPLLVVSSAASAQNESALRQYFEGMTVVVKMDMPGTSDGVSVHPERSMPVDFRKVAQALKTYGIGLHSGESVMVTKVHIKKNHIEFQLGGGGFGSFADYMSTANTYSAVPAYEGKSRREKDIEEQLKWETSSYRRRELKEDLDELRRDRRRDNAWASSQAAQANIERQELEQHKRKESGSRFNIKYDEFIPPEAMTPRGIMEALSQYVDFRGAQPSAPQAVPITDDTGSGVTALKKGLTVHQVEKLLGPAATAETDQQGSVEIMTRTYELEGQTIVARFAAGVLIEYAIKSN